MDKPITSVMVDRRSIHLAHYVPHLHTDLVTRNLYYLIVNFPPLNEETEKDPKHKHL